MKLKLKLALAKISCWNADTKKMENPTESWFRFFQVSVMVEKGVGELRMNATELL